MTWELISLKAHPHRTAGEDAMALLRKSVRRSDRDGVSAVQFSVDICPMPVTVKNGNEKQLVPQEQAHFRVTADLAKRMVMFDIGSADAALPSILRGGGLGSLAISELVNWAKAQYPDFAVVTGRISAAMLNYPNAEANAVKCLKNFGFAVARASVGGIQFEAAAVGQLKSHVNTAKVEISDPIRWASGLTQDNIKLGQQLVEQSKDIAAVKEQLHQVAQTKQSPMPFLGGLLAGCVAGTAIAAFLFSI